MKHLFTLLSLLLLLPVAAWGQEQEQTDVPYIYYTWDDESQTFKPNDGKAANATVVTKSVTKWNGDDNGGWYVAEGTINIGGVTVTGNVHLILADGCSLTVTGGIQVQDNDDDPETPSTNSLTIYAQSTGNNMGKLEATGNMGAGIGGGYNGDGGTITIHGGNVKATVDGARSAGIGGGFGGDGGTIIISGGTVTATGDGGGAGIGGGDGDLGGGAGGTITISGGTVTATGGAYGAGIGVGSNGAGGTFSTGENGNAFIIASNEGCFGDAIRDQSGKNNNTWSGVIFEGDNAGAVYGSPITLTTDATIPAGKTLEIKDGETLVVGEGVTLTNAGTLTNDGTIINYGTSTLGEGSGTLDNVEGTIISLSSASITLDVDEEEELTANILIGNQEKTVIWENDNEDGVDLVTDNNKATVKAKGVGKATITVKADEADNVEDVVATCEVKVAHTWGEPTYKWSDDGKTCTATRTCETNSEHTESATVTVTSKQTKAPTCTEMGETTYTAIFAEEWAVTQTKIVADIKATGHSLTKTDYKAPTCTEDGNIEYWQCEGCGKYFSDEAGTTEISLDETVIYATGHHYVNGTCTVCGEKDPDYRPDPISYYNIYVEDVCDGVDITTSKNVVREGGSISLYVEKDTANYTFDNFQVYYKRNYYGPWEVLEEGVQPGEYPIRNIWTHIYIKAEGAEEKEDPTGIEQVEGVKVYTKDGSLYVQTPQREQVLVISMTGVVVKNEEQVGLKQYHGLQPGIYVVRIGERAYKLRLN